MDSETPDMFIRETGGVTLVRLKATNITAVTDVARITNAFAAMLKGGKRKVIIDFKLVEHAGSSMLGLIISIQKQIKELNGRLVISHPENIEELLRVSHTTHLFKLAPDSRAAMDIVTGKVK